MGSAAQGVTGIRPLAALLIVAALLGGCCDRYTKHGADLEVYSILRDRRPCVPQLAGSLHVDAADRLAEAKRQGRHHVLSLEDALALAAAASRQYLSQREDVYIAALDLTTAQNEFNPLFGAAGSGEIAAPSSDAASTSAAEASASTDSSASRALETGGSVVLSLASDFLRNLASGDPFRLAQSLLALDVVLPLARGSGWVARENLTQAERDTLYAMRDFARFQQEFTVDVASRYYRLLQLRDALQNEERTYESLRQLLERQQALGAQGAGRIPDFEVDQTKQDVFRADQRRVIARIELTSAVDGFKLLLGIPIGAAVEIPEGALEELQARGLVGAPYDEEEAVLRARRLRLDLRNARDQEVDAWRRVLVARDGLGTQVDLRLGGALRTAETQPLNLRDADVEGLLGLDIDLPLERTAERNAFRESLIQAARARRSRLGREDEVELAVRDAYRRLERAAKSYRIQEDGVKLAERRVKSTDELLAAGRARTRDRLEAEDALVRARNARTLALVDHATARLELERDVGTLRVGADATWTETPPVEAPAAGATASSSLPPPPTATAPPPSDR